MHELPHVYQPQASGGEVDTQERAEVGRCGPHSSSIGDLNLIVMTGSQCREMRFSVTWALFGSLKTRCAAIF